MWSNCVIMTWCATGICWVTADSGGAEATGATGAARTDADGADGAAGADANGAAGAGGAAGADAAARFSASHFSRSANSPAVNATQPSV
jgi:hypothetical protein